jgi:hypothetical protein
LSEGSQWPEPDQKQSPSTDEGNNSADGEKQTGKDDENQTTPKENSKLTIFDEFEGLDSKREGKPVIFFFYCKAESQKDRSKAVLSTQQMARLLAHPKVSSALGNFNCYRKNFKKTKKSIMKKYKVRAVPMVIVFDATGKVIYRLTNYKIKPETLVALLEKLVSRSGKNLDKLRKKRARNCKKEPKKEEKEGAS